MVIKTKKKTGVRMNTTEQLSDRFHAEGSVGGGRGFVPPGEGGSTCLTISVLSLQGVEPASLSPSS